MGNDLKRVLNATAYEGIVFPHQDFREENGHDKVEHVAYGVDGADNEPVGRKARKFHFKIPFINGIRGNGSWDEPLFPTVFRALLQKFDETPQGNFVHPYRGPLTVQVDDWTPEINQRVVNGCYVTVSMTEQNNDASTQQGDANSGSPSQTSTDPATQVNNSYNSALAQAAIALAALGVGLPAGVDATTVPNALASLQSTTLSYVAAQQTFATLLDFANAWLNYAPLVSIAGHDTRAAFESMRSAVARYQDRYFGGAAPRFFTVQQKMSLMRIAALIYGDAAKASLLRNANQIPDEAFVPAGTVLRVL